MSTVLRYTRPHLLSALHDELIAAGLPPTRCEGGYAGRPDELTLEYAPDVDEVAVAAVVARHDREAAQRGWDEARAREAADGDELVRADVRLAAAIEGLPAPLTLAALRPVLLTMLAVLRALVREAARRRGAN